jgi:hypothetical protein
MDISKAYWLFFNFMVRRVVAVAFIIGGSIVALSWLPALFSPNGTIPVNGVEESDLFYRAFAVVLPTLAAVLGVFLYRAKPFVPSGQDHET